MLFLMSFMDHSALKLPVLLRRRTQIDNSLYICCVCKKTSHKQLVPERKQLNSGETDVHIANCKFNENKRRIVTVSTFCCHSQLIISYPDYSNSTMKTIDERSKFAQC